MGLFDSILGGGGGGGGGSAPATQTVTQENAISKYAAPYVENMLGQAAALTDINKNPYVPYGGQRTADFTGLQNQAFGSASGLQTPQGYETGSNLALAGGLGALNTAQQAGMYGRAGANAGLGYARQATDPNAIQAYMNPYLQAALAPQLELMNRQYGQQAAQNASQATQAGAFGGSRFGIQQAQNALNQNLATQNLLGSAYNQAYNTAQQNMQAAANLGMQGAGMGLSGIGAQQAGYNAAGAAGTNLANIAGQGLGAQQNIINQQSALGAQQQQQQQNVLNQQYQDFLNQRQYPYQQLSYMQNILSGLPLASSVQNVYSNPSMLSQVAGLGTTAYALNKMKKGGKVEAKKRPAGLAELALHKMA